MKEQWLLRGAIVPINVETTSALVAEIKRLIAIVGGMALAQPEQQQRRRENDDDDDDTQVYKRPWAGLTDEEIDQGCKES